MAEHKQKWRAGESEVRVSAGSRRQRATKRRDRVEAAEVARRWRGAVGCGRNNAVQEPQRHMPQQSAVPYEREDTHAGRRACYFVI